MRNGLIAIVMVSMLGGSPVEPADGWVEMPGPVGSPAYDFTLTPSADVLVATDEGVFRLDRSTSEWQTTGLAASGMRALMTSSDGTVYAGGVGVWTSSDNGGTWRQADEGLEGGGRSVRAFAELNGTILAATNRGLFKRNEGAAGWVFNEGGPAEAIRAIAVDGTGTIFVGFRHFVFRSFDGGESWSSQLWLDSVVTSIATAPGGVVLVGAADDGFGPTVGHHGKLHLSLDGGDTFARLDINVDVDIGGGFLEVSDVRSVAITEDGVLLVGGHRGSVPGGPGGGVWYSEDLGATWFRTLYLDVDVLDIAELGADEHWIGSKRGPMRPFELPSHSGVELVAAGLKSRHVNIRGILSTSKGLLVWGDGFRMQWWEKANNRWYENQRRASTIRGVAIGWYPTVLVTAWGGMGFGNLDFPWGWGFWDEARDWEIDGFRPTMAARDPEHRTCAADARSLRCPDWFHWNQTRFESSSITALASFPWRHMFAALKPDDPTMPVRIIRSTGDLESWETVWSGTSAIRAGTLVTAATGRMYGFLDDGYLLVSDENGEQWERRGVLLPPRDILVVDEDAILYTAVSNRVMYSDDGGWSWKPFGKPIEGVDVTSVATDGEEIYVGTSTRGVFRSVKPRTRRPAARRVQP